MFQTAISGFLLLFVSLILHNRSKAKLSDEDLLYFERTLKSRFLRYTLYAIAPVLLNFLFGLKYNSNVLPVQILFILSLSFYAMALYRVFTMLKGQSAELNELKYTLSGFVLGQLILLSLLLYMAA